MNKKNFYSFISPFVFVWLYVYSAIAILFCLLFAYLRVKVVVRFLLNFWAKSMFWWIGYRLEIKGQENFDPNKKYILLANHSSLFDIPAIMSFFPTVSWFGRKNLLNMPFFGQILRMIDFIPRERGGVKDTKDMLNHLIRNSNTKTIAMFPEGTRTLDGNLRKFHRGFIYLLKAAQHDVLPVTLVGFYDLKPKIRRSINFSAKISVVIHKPIKREDLVEKADDEIIDIVKKQIASGFNN